MCDAARVNRRRAKMPESRTLFTDFPSAARSQPCSNAPPGQFWLWIDKARITVLVQSFPLLMIGVPVGNDDFTF
jgi:hypothetical protein